MQKSSNKFTIIALVVVFVLPVVLAKLALDNDWFNKSATNRGQLIDPAIPATEVLAETDTKWKLIYVIPATCDLACENAILSIRQVRQAVGRQQDRVESVFLYTENSDMKAVEQIKVQGLGDIFKQDVKNVNKVFNPLGINAIFVADTLHNIVLRYASTQDQQQAIMDSRDILADLRKLLKLSRIG